MAALTVGNDPLRPFLQAELSQALLLTSYSFLPQPLNGLNEVDHSVLGFQASQNQELLVSGW